MKILVHNSPTTLAPYKQGYPNLGILSSPRRYYKAHEGIEDWSWAADNDAFGNWDEGRYLEMLNYIRTELSGCLFITAPDVVGDAVSTLRNFSKWRPIIGDLPVALVGQDGMEDPPWDEFDTFFIGGSTEWKMGDTAKRLAYTAKERGKWLHMGRVNGQQRLRYAMALGCDSIDGTSIGWFKTQKLMPFLRHAAGPRQMMFE